MVPEDAIDVATTGSAAAGSLERDFLFCKNLVQGKMI